MIRASVAVVGIMHQLHEGLCTALEQGRVAWIHVVAELGWREEQLAQLHEHAVLRLCLLLLLLLRRCTRRCGQQRRQPRSRWIGVVGAAVVVDQVQQQLLANVSWRRRTATDGTERRVERRR